MAQRLRSRRADLTTRDAGGISALDSALATETEKAVDGPPRRSRPTVSSEAYLESPELLSVDTRDMHRAIVSLREELDRA
jgi:hypothetical protein